MTVIPLFCSRFLKGIHREQNGGASTPISPGGRFNAWFSAMFNRLLDFYERRARWALRRPALTLAALLGVFVGSLAIYPFLGRALFPRTDAGQFTLNMKIPTGSRIEVTDQYVARIEALIRHVVPPSDLKMIVSNIGVVNDFSSLYTTVVCSAALACKRDVATRAHRRLPAARCDGTTPPSGGPRAGFGAGPLQSRPVQYCEAYAGAAQCDLVRDRISVRNTIIRANTQPAIHHRSSALTGTPMGRLTPPVLPMTDLRLVQREAELLTKHWRKARQPNERIDKSHQLAR
jgi:hypothetical protein